MAFADDVFISYAREDAAAYAEELANKLNAVGLSCHIDQWASQPGRILPRELVVAAWRASMLLVIATPAAGRSLNVAREIKIFRHASARLRPLLVIDVAESLAQARWAHLVSGVHPIDEAFERMAAGRPANDVIRRAQTVASFSKRNPRLRRVAGFMVAVVIALGIVAIALAIEAARETASLSAARDQLDSTNSQLKRTDASLKQTEAERQAANSKLAETRGMLEKTEQEKTAALSGLDSARSQTKEQQRRAQALELSEVSRRELSTSPESALARAIEAYEMAPLIEARAALLASMNAFVPHHCPRRHKQKALTGVFNASGTLVATAGYDQVVRVTSVQQNKESYQHKFDSSVLELAFAPSAGPLLVQPYGELPLLWRWDDDSIIRLGEKTFGGNHVDSAVFSRDGGLIAILSYDDTSSRPSKGRVEVRHSTGALVWANNIEDKGSDQVHREGSVIFVNDIRDQLIVVSRDGKILSFDPSDGTLLNSAHLGGAPWGQIALRDKTTLAVQVSSNRVEYFRTYSLERVTDIPQACSDGSLRGIADAKDRLLAVSGDAGTTVCEIFAGVSSRKTLPDTDKVHYDASFAPNGESVVLWGDGKQARIFDVATGGVKLHLRGHFSSIEGVRFSADGSALLSWADDGQTRLWFPPQPRAERVVALDEATGHPLAMSPDGRTAIFLSRNDQMMRWTDGPKPELATLDAAQDQWEDGATARFSASGSHLISIPHRSGGEAGSRRPAIWRTSDWKRVNVDYLRDSYFDASLDANGSILALVNHRFEVELRNLRTGKLLRGAHAGLQLVDSVTMSPDGRVLAVANSIDSGTRTTLWARRKDGTLAKLFHVDDFTDYTRSQVVAFARSGRRVVLSERDGNSLVVWGLDLRGDDVVARQLSTIHDPVSRSRSSVVFSADGRLLLTLGDDARIWDTQSGQEVERPDAWGEYAAFRQDGSLVLVAERRMQFADCDSCAVRDLLRAAKAKLASRQGCATP